MEVGSIARRLLGSVRSLAHDFEEKARSPLDGLIPILVHPYGDSIGDLKKILGRRFMTVGIDGSMAREEALDMLIFYVCSAAYEAKMVLLEDRAILEKDTIAKEESISFSGAVPLWSENVGELTGGEYYVGEEAETAFDNFSFSMMTLSELYTAINALNKGYKVVLLDRSLSGSYQHLLRDARLALREGLPSLSEAYADLGYDRALARLDVELAVRLGPDGYVPPIHGLHAIRRLIYRALRDGSSSPRGMDLPDGERRALERRADRLVSRGLLEKHDGEYSLHGRMLDFRRRLHELTHHVAHRFFEASEEHPLLFGGRWMSPREINLVSLLLLQEAYRMAVEENILLVGIVKDTNVSDLSRSVIPLLASKDYLKVEGTPYRSDRALLTVMASHESLEAPWRTLAYDSAFAMLGYSREDGVLEALRRVSGLDRLFVRSFFQSRRGERVSSPVFLYDRPVYPNVDEVMLHELEVKEKGLSGIGVFKAGMMLEVGVRSSMDDGLLKLIEVSDDPEVAEAYGHNRLLFLADKAVKLDARMKSQMLRSVVALELAPLARREKLHWILRRFREERALAERERGW